MQGLRLVLTIVALFQAWLLAVGVVQVQSDSDVVFMCGIFNIVVNLVFGGINIRIIINSLECKEPTMNLLQEIKDAFEWFPWPEKKPEPKIAFRPEFIRERPEPLTANAVFFGIGAGCLIIIWIVLFAMFGNALIGG